MSHPVADTRENHVRNKHTEKLPSQQDRMSSFPLTLLVLSDLTIMSSQCWITSANMLNCFPITNIQAPTIARKIIQYITTFGRPGMILSDLGTQFTADIFKQITSMTGIAFHHTTSRNPKAIDNRKGSTPPLKTTILSLADHKVGFLDLAVAVHKSFLQWH
ncbi:hypothetical protein TNCV_3031061 [Trichonephila clavipes]|nr:hypothetical protein TNCV_3031061 [Trichonephila clavipes]